MEQVLYAKVVMIRRKYLYSYNKRRKPRNITSRGNLQDQNAGSVLIMSG